LTVLYYDMDVTDATDMTDVTSVTNSNHSWPAYPTQRYDQGYSAVGDH